MTWLAALQVYHTIEKKKQHETAYDGESKSHLQGRLWQSLKHAYKHTHEEEPMLCLLLYICQYIQ